MEGGIVAWGLSPSLVGLAKKTISRTRVPRVSYQRSSFVIAYLVCVTNVSKEKYEDHMNLLLIIENEKKKNF